MNKEEKELIKNKISKKIKFLNIDIENLKEITKPISPENAIGRISRMDAINNKSVNEAALRQAKSKLKNLEKALIDIENEDFGKCTKCGNQIPIQRIILMPGSQKCINCAK